MNVKNMITGEQFRTYLTVFVSLEHYLKIEWYMKKIILPFLFVFCISSIYAQVAVVEKKDTTSVEEVLEMNEATYDFGKIPQGKPVTHVFEVINNGKDSLKISNVQASCGCTTPEWERDQAQAPGKKTKITVGYNAASEGQFLKSITITYNGTQSKQINIKGEVWKTPLTSAPENKELKSLKED
jgi:hypothetical protein